MERRNDPINCVKKWWAIISALVILGIGLMMSTPQGLTNEGKIAISILLFAIVLWITKAFPYTICGVLILIVMYFSGIGNSFNEFAIGFSSSTVFFVLSVMLVGQSVCVSGLSSRIAMMLLSLSNGKQYRLAIVTPIFIIILTLLIPSAMVRIMILKPTFKEVFEHSVVNKANSFSKYIMFMLGVLNPMASFIFLSGGAAPIFAAEIMSKFDQNITWVKWFLYMGLPVLLVYLLATLVLYLIYSPHFSKGSLFLPIEKNTFTTLNSQEKYVLFVIGLMLISLVVASFFGVPSAIPAMLGAVMLFLPGIGVLKQKHLFLIDWNLIFMIGVALSVSNCLIKNGSIDQIARIIFDFVSITITSRYTIVFSIVLLLTLSRLAFTSLLAFLAVVMPATLALATKLQLDCITICLIIVLTSSILFFPFQMNTYLVASEGEAYTLKDSITTGWIIFNSSIIVVSLFFYFVY